MEVNKCNKKKSFNHFGADFLDQFNEIWDKYKDFIYNIECNLTILLQINGFLAPFNCYNSQKRI